MNTKFDAGLTDPTKISVHQTAEPAQPVARVFVHKTGGNVGIRWSGVPVDGAPLMHDGELLYTADAICEAVEDEVRRRMGVSA